MRSLVAFLSGAALLFVVLSLLFEENADHRRRYRSHAGYKPDGAFERPPTDCPGERGYIATNGHCARSTTHLLHSLSMTRTERDGYSYTLECSVVISPSAARHLPAPAGSPIRYPNLAIDATMQVHESLTRAP